MQIFFTKFEIFLIHKFLRYLFCPIVYSSSSATPATWSLTAWYCPTCHCVYSFIIPFIFFPVIHIRYFLLDCFPGHWPFTLVSPIWCEAHLVNISFPIFYNSVLKFQFGLFSNSFNFSAEIPPYVCSIWLCFFLKSWAYLKSMF